ncbi:acetoin dehydrogenase dihydrolipoyllysine-residue acetyltransferase subunit [Phyllobacterium phragmitis]|uniref:Acetoin dehydrogenase dihydrolipoyllysine-residue acetyltransferase subunit n=1 Tax=Phyllobacterium phragmitis TaxID=2670329 RepID=A0A2S9IQG1_9HYPH|nr:acetoin dehydrogenase dihydrolipoyllysine-residue acetyltransferase subunit [Phyllobacterium phragmitis]PRD42759.1 acetoin dehydrogenase dihydrolipoyllysine-residue acetyltransferase subunit [Phyllobacterium phragmitis]
MPVEVILPKVDMDMETGRISRWYAHDGDAVTKGQLLFEIETDKAAMEIDAPASGILRDVSAAEGATVPVGQAVAWIFAEGEEYSPVSPSLTEPLHSAGKPPSSDPLGHPLPAGEKGIDGDGNIPSPRRGGSQSEPGEKEAPRATPLARRLAADAGLKLSEISGSGPKGRITRKDIEANIAMSAPSAKPEAPAAAAPLHAAWLRQGRGAAPAMPVVLIHGFGADLNSWRPLLAGVQLDSPVLAIDLPGHGGSPRDIPESLGAIAEAVERTLEANQIGSFILVGHSFGGAVAATLAAQSNADIRGLVLISPAGLGPEINGAFLEGFVRARSEASLMPWLKQLVADESQLTRPFVNATLAQSADEGLRAAQKAIIDSYFADGTQTFDIRPALASLRLPVRVIFGAADRIIPATHTAGLPGEIAVHIFAATRHMPQLERREQVLKIIQELARAAG